MEQQIAVTAEWLAEQLAKSGSVALEGITFDTAKAVIKPLNWLLTGPGLAQTPRRSPAKKLACPSQKQTGD